MGVAHGAPGGWWMCELLTSLCVGFVCSWVGTNLNFQNKDYHWTDYIDGVLKIIFSPITGTRSLVPMTYSYLHVSSLFLPLMLYSSPDTHYLPSARLQEPWLTLSTTLLCLTHWSVMGLGTTRPTVVSLGQNQSVRASVIWWSYLWSMVPELFIGKMDLLTIAFY